MPRRCKCHLCKKDITVDIAKIYKDTTLKTPKDFKFCSNECIEKYKTEINFKVQEKLDFAELLEYIILIHNQKYIPNGFYVMLYDLRNGTIRRSGMIISKNKEGVKWCDILITYKYCLDKINWALDNKEFKSDTAKLNYCLAIVKNNIDKAVFNHKKELNNKTINTKNIIENETECEYKPRKFKNDISDIL